MFFWCTRKHQEREQHRLRDFLLRLAVPALLQMYNFRPARLRLSSRKHPRQWARFRPAWCLRPRLHTPPAGWRQAPTPMPTNTRGLPSFSGFFSLHFRHKLPIRHKSFTYSLLFNFDKVYCEDSICNGTHLIIHQNSGFARGKMTILRQNFTPFRPLQRYTFPNSQCFGRF